MPKDRAGRGTNQYKSPGKAFRLGMERHIPAGPRWGWNSCGEPRPKVAAPGRRVLRERGPAATCHRVPIIPVLGTVLGSGLSPSRLAKGHPGRLSIPVPGAGSPQGHPGRLNIPAAPSRIIPGASKEVEHPCSSLQD